MLEILKKVINEKKEWNLYRKRVKKLPKDYRNAMEGIQIYMFNFTGSPAIMQVLYDLLEMFEESVAEGKKVTNIVGNDLGAFCEDIFKAIPEENWIVNYKNKLKEKANSKINKEGVVK